MNNIIFTKVEIFRNLKDYKFLPKLESGKKEEIVEKLASALPNYSVLNSNSIDSGTKSEMMAYDLISTKTNTIMINRDAKLFVKLFEDEQISITSATEGLSDKSFKECVELSKGLNNKISFSYSDNYGYLMSDLKNIGSGIKIEICICLDAITQLGKMEQVRQNVRKLGYELKPTKYSGLFNLVSVCNLGMSEDEAFRQIETTAQKLNDLEIESAKMLEVSNHDQILDRGLRSFAILNSAYLLSVDELFRLVSSIRMCLNLNLINVKDDVLAKLVKLCLTKTSCSNFVGQTEICSQSELKDLAEKVKSIIKGGENV